MIVSYIASSRPSPRQIFIDNSTRAINLTCPLHHPLLPTVWFWNGVKLVNATERNLVTTSVEPERLYGMYQCLVGSLEPDPYLNGRNDIISVARAMPYGKILAVYPLSFCIFAI